MTPPDAKGHGLLRARLAALAAHARDALARPLPQPPGGRFAVTGTGSSEAHARYLVHLLNTHTPCPAEYVPISALLEAPAPWCRARVLAVFSQGVSPNAQAALDHAAAFAGCVLFTATTPEGARAAGRPDRAALLEGLVAAGGAVVTFPVENEYTTLVRLVGPFCAYLAAWRFAAAVPGSALAPPAPQAVAAALDTQPPAYLAQALREAPERFAAGFHIVAHAPLCTFAQNLAYKFMEGLYWSPPPVWDYLQFAHGPFQEASLRPKPCVLIHAPSGPGAHLADRAERMLAGAGVPAYRLPHDTAPGHLAVLALETQLNRLVLDLVERLGVDQVNWPSKGRDDPLYGFHRIQAAPT